MKNISKRTVITQWGEIEYTLERKNVKNINMRVDTSGAVNVSAHPAVGTATIDGFVSSKASFIIKAQERFRERSENSPEPKKYESGEIFSVFGENYVLCITDTGKDTVKTDGGELILSIHGRDTGKKRETLIKVFFDELLTEEIAAEMNRYFPFFRDRGVLFPEMTLRTMRTRWGSCLKSKARISMNRALIEKRKECIEYVTLHEMCHLIYADHSERFYGLLSSLMPDWKERRRALNAR